MHKILCSQFTCPSSYLARMRTANESIIENTSQIDVG